MDMDSFVHGPHTLRYRRRGSGPPVVLLHNGGTSHAIWSDVVPLLHGYETFALDLLGFGQSSRPESVTGYALETYVELLGAFIDAHGLAPAFLVGNCMGSATSLAFAIGRREAVRAMVLVNTLTPATFGKGLYGPTLNLPQRTPRLVSAMSKVALGKWLGGFGVRSQLGRHGVERNVHTRDALTACWANASQSRSMLGVLAHIPAYAALDRFVPPADFPPICSVWGLENRILRAEEGRALVETLEPARQEWLEGCGHLPMLEQPERMAAIIQGFFSNEA